MHLFVHTSWCRRTSIVSHHVFSLFKYQYIIVSLSAWYTCITVLRWHQVMCHHQSWSCHVLFSNLWCSSFGTAFTSMKVMGLGPTWGILFVFVCLFCLHHSHRKNYIFSCVCKQPLSDKNLLYSNSHCCLSIILLHCETLDLISCHRNFVDKWKKVI